MSMTYQMEAARLPSFSWAAIIAGTVVTLMAQISLSILGIGVGLSGVSPQSGTTPDLTTYSVAAGVWWLVASVVASLIGGFVAGRLTGGIAGMRGGYHGLVTWATSTLLVLALLGSTASGILGGVFGAASSVLGGAGRAVGGAVQAASPGLTGNNLFQDIERQVRSSSGGQDPAQLRDTAINALKAALTGDRAQQEQAGREAADALAQARGIPVDQARAEVARYQQQYARTLADAKTKATQVAEASAKTASQGAMIAFAALVLGALAGSAGGLLGSGRSRRDVDESLRVR